MRFPFRPSTLMTSTILAFSVASTSSAQRGGDRLRERGERVQPRAEARFAITATDSTAAERPYRIYLIPRVRWDDDKSSVEAEVRYSRRERTLYPYNVSVTDRVIWSDGERANRIQADGEIDLLHNNLKGAGRRVFLAALGELQHTQRSGFLAEGALELDFTVLGDPSGGPSLALGGLGYFDHFTPTEGDSDSGFTAGTEALWIISDVLELDAEYDFDSEFNGEDSFAVRFFWDPPVQRFSPRLLLGAAKHGSYMVGLRLRVR